MGIRGLSVGFVLLLTAISLRAEAFSEPVLSELPVLNLEPHTTTLSGVSSGAYMAVQLQVIHSKMFRGAASVGGGVFWCAQGDTQKATSQCMGNLGTTPPDTFINKARELAAQGLIDPLENLLNHKLFILAGDKDTIINPLQGDRLGSFFSALAGREKITQERLPSFAHGFPTLDFGNPCDSQRLPWMSKCAYDGAGRILNELYGALVPRAAGPTDEHLYKFSQAPYREGDTPLFGHGWVYIPEACAQGQTCRLHVALHGCQMNPDYIQDKFARNSGFNAWAETNRLVVLYPQSNRKLPENPFACWDWFGFTGPNYITREGAHVRALMAMIRRLGGRDSSELTEIPITAHGMDGVGRCDRGCL